MTKTSRTRARIPAGLWLLPAGLCAGLVNGLLGCGGGVVTVLTLGALLPQTSDPVARTRDIFAMTVLAIVPMSLASAFFYGGFGSLDWKAFLHYLAPALLGGAVGGFLLDRVNTVLLKKIFALLIIYSGIRILTG